MKAKQFNELTTQELIEREKELKSELFNLRFQHATNQLENPLRIPATKKEIALVMTILREKELEA